MEEKNCIVKIRENIRKVIVGKEKVLDLLLTARTAGGHVLLEDVPGTGKTMMAKSLARSMDGKFSRIQFTPDLLPSDVTGLNYYNQKAGEFLFKEGPAFCNILLADEINRATPRTQSSLLECMEEHQITIDGETRKLEEPFFVIATQNPVETTGTFPLPEAQMDRFFMCLSMGLPDKEEELAILERFEDRQPLMELPCVCTREELLNARAEYKKVYVHPDLKSYLVEVVQATRTAGDVIAGVSPRGTLALFNGVKAYAYVKGRDHVVPEDIKDVAVPILAHRMVMTSGYGQEESGSQAMKRILDQVPVPTEEWKRKP
ncbi:AAA family ATPase [Blautia producta]|uniref:MoxR family ATPase n=2 Tax=Blautia producta TaxID=33035 RepID=A0A7G5MU63_9FIRM|nr:MoxR family ATPase [Blautia producta]QIB53638.1 MoxR family ATPase [Blautia producta ATCC 27340 = DSM 2950]QMW78156.1 MoxR family ATPase [Blautia producta]